MNNCVGATFAAVLGLGVVTTQAAVITIDFDGLSSGTIPANTGAADGATIAYNNVSAFSAANYSGNTDGMVAYASAQNAASITFTAPVGKQVELLGFEVGHYNDVDNALLHYYFVIDGVAGEVFTQGDGTVSLTNIVGQTVAFHFKDRAFDASSGAYGDWGIDEFQYQVVPEPASAALISIAAAGLLLNRQRR